ncbi:FAD-binding oxidoreductase [Kitasatospora brasiliensis]|uniref:FAD-binding oxidoreductase n=1 Tax=Kitasatospora brasiliensis TaxID=3058040 RepID=UPI00292D0129|nr:FAD-binding protein [Kitasatospora sp. K002]
MEQGRGDAAAPTVRPGDPRYPVLTSGINQRWRATPGRIRLPRTTAETVAAVQDAVDADARLSVRSGGHCFEDFVFHSEVEALIDMSAMNAVGYDEEHHAFSVGPGARLLDVYEALFLGWGVTVPGGVCATVGAGGHVAGGGYGLLSRSLGLVVDHLHGVEVVVVDDTGRARAVVATREDTGALGDLWWAHTGGGGGSLGIVTRYLFRSPGARGRAPAQALPEPPAEVLVSALALPWDRLTPEGFAGLLGTYGAWHQEHAAPGTPGSALGSLLMLNHRANGSVGLLTQVDATAPGAEKLLDAYLDRITEAAGVRPQPVHGPVGEFGPMPELLRPKRLPWLTAARYIGTNTPVLNDPTLRGKHKSAYARTALTEEQLHTVHRHLTRVSPGEHPNPQFMLVAMSYGGEIAATAPGATAVAQRDSAYKLLYQAFWTDPEDDAANVARVRELYRDVYADTGGVPVPGPRSDGAYVNYPDADLGDPAHNTSGVPWSTLYYKENYPRLQAAKAQWDPGDRFRHAQSIGLPS